MLSREQVLHVARLARLELSEQELERFGGELSKVGDWIDKIGGRGDLAGVPPPTCPRHRTWSTSRPPCAPTSRGRACPPTSRWRRRPTPATAGSACPVQ